MKLKLALSCLAIGASMLSIGSYASTDVGQNLNSPKPTATDATAAQDASVAAKIKAEMAAQRVASLSQISVDSDDAGTVSLSGYALSQDDIDKTVSIARNTAGVTAIKNSLTVKAND